MLSSSLDDHVNVWRKHIISDIHGFQYSWLCFALTSLAAAAFCIDRRTDFCPTDFCPTYFCPTDFCPTDFCPTDFCPTDFCPRLALYYCLPSLYTFLILYFSLSVFQTLWSFWPQKVCHAFLQYFLLCHLTLLSCKYRVVNY